MMNDEFQFLSNVEVALVIEHFRPFAEIDEHSFAGCLVANRATNLMQSVEIEVDGKSEHWEFDQTKLCGWRTLGTEPILEIKSTVTSDKWWYLYHLHTSGEWMWCQLLPSWEENEGPRTQVQFTRFFRLLLMAVIVLGYYAVASIPLFILLAGLFTGRR